MKKLALSSVGLVSLIALAGFYGTADPNLTSATSDIQTYFSANIGTIVALVVGIALLVWLLRMAFHSAGVRKPKSVD